MPLWIIYHTPDTFVDAESKQSFVTDITKHYTNVGLPAFYVVVNFIKLDSEGFFVGGELKKSNFVRIIMSHIAVNQPNEDAAYKNLRERLHKAITPHIFDKGYESEFHVEETERRMWEINGLVPPPFRSAEEKEWKDTNKPTPWQN